MKAWIDWFPCAFMRGTREALATAFPSLRPSLAEPIRRRRVNPFTRREEEMPDWDPSPSDAVCEVPERPPLTFVPFRTAGYWYEEYPDLFAIALDVERPEDDDERFESRALFGNAHVHGCELRVLSVPRDLRDTLARLDASAQRTVADAWSEVLASSDHSTEEPHLRDGRRRTVRELSEFARDAAAAGEDVFISSNT
jgi:hypothetical protein